MNTTLAIIGTAGRGAPVTKAHARFMLEKAESLIDNLVNSGHLVTLVSGGAAGADHTAVLLAHKLCLPLKLYLPALWDHKYKSYEHNNSGFKSPASISNYYHRNYSLEVFGHRDISLRQIDKMIKDGEATIDVGAGFHDRNSRVATSDIVLAFTFGEGDTPLADSGTYDTWVKAQKNDKELHHVSLKGIS